MSEVHKTKFSERKRKIGERDILKERDAALARKLAAPPASHSKQRVAPAHSVRSQVRHHVCGWIDRRRCRLASVVR